MIKNKNNNSYKIKRNNKRRKINVRNLKQKRLPVLSVKENLNK